MNGKTARLINKYAGRTEENRRELKRRWNAMTVEERSRFRERMLQTVGEDEE